MIAPVLSKFAANRSLNLEKRALEYLEKRTEKCGES